MKASINEEVTKWFKKIGKQRRPSSAYVFAIALLCYIAYMGVLFRTPERFRIAGMDEIYTISSVAQSIVYGFFSSHVLSRWWDLRIAVGSVAGGISDIAMVLKGYFKQVGGKISETSKASLAEKLRLVHSIHICEVFGVAHIPFGVAGSDEKQRMQKSLIDCLADILGEVTIISEMHEFSDSVKFSMLPAIQASLSCIRSRAGDCSMILNTNMPKAFRAFVRILTAIHLLYLPVYLGNRTQWNMQAVMMGSSLGFSALAGFTIIILSDFKNPFIANGFPLERIVSNTFQVIEDCLEGPARRRE